MTIFSSRLPKVILTGSPSLLWMAADSGNFEVFNLLLSYLEPLANDRTPTPAASGGITIIQIALSKKRWKILTCIFQHPRWFPR